MSRRRWIIALGIVVGLLVAAEVAVRRWECPRACLQIINEADETIEDLVVIYEGHRIAVGNLPSSQRTNLWLSAGRPGPLQLEYRQKKNALQGFQIPDYDPAQCIKDAFKQVLVIQTNQVQRSMEDDETRIERESLGSRFLHWLQSDLDSRK